MEKKTEFHIGLLRTVWVPNGVKMGNLGIFANFHYLHFLLNEFSDSSEYIEELMYVELKVYQLQLQ